MSGIGGVVNAEFKVDAAKAAADLQDLVKKFAAVEKAVQAASKGLDTQGASTAAVNAAHKELARQLERSTGAVKVSEKEWVKYAATLYTIHNVASLVGRTIERVYDAAAEGAKIQAAQQFFENAGKSIESYRTATNGMISDAELMKKANLADSMGIDEATFKKLVVVAEASALKTGQSFDHMFNSIIVGTARSSRLLLDNLGIIVSVDQANQNYARSVLEVGKNHVATQQEINAFIASMDAEAKQLAFVQEVAKQSQGTINEYSQLVDKTAQNFAQLEASAQNAADALKVALTDAVEGAIPPMIALFNHLKDVARVLKDMNGTPIAVGTLLGAAAGGLLGGAGGAALGASAGGSLGGAVSAVMSGNATTAEQAQFNEDYKAAFQDASKILEDIGLQGETSFAELARQFRSLGSTGSEVIDSALRRLVEISKKYKIFQTQAGLLLVPAETPKPASPPATDTKMGSSRDKTDFTHRNENFRDSIAEKVGDALRKKINEEYEAKLALLDKAEKMKARADQLDKAAGKHELKGQENFADYNQSLKEESERAFSAMVAQIDQVVGGLTVSLRNLASTVIQGASGIADALMGQGGLMTAIGQLAGGILEGVGGLMQTLVSVAGDALAPITFGISAIVAKPLNAMISVFTEGGAAALSAFGKFGDTMAPIIELMTYVGDVLYGVKNALGDSFDEAAAAMRDGVTLLGRTLIFLADTGVIKAVADMFAQLFTSVVNIFTGFSLLREGLSLLFNMFTSLGTIFDLAIGALKFFGDFLMGLNDFIVVMMRDAFGQTGWGKLSSELRVEFDPAPMEDNTEAVRENTAALRDFAREFRNLPANFKANGYIFDSQAGLRLHDPLGSASFAPGLGGNNQRTRT